MMWPFHRHTWKVIKTTTTRIAPPVRVSGPEMEGSAESIRRLIFGTTDVLLQCETCSDVRVETMVGHETD